MAYSAGDGFLPSWGSGMKPRDPQDTDVRQTAFSGNLKGKSAKSLIKDREELPVYGALDSDIQKTRSRLKPQHQPMLSEPFKKSLWLLCLPTWLGVISLWVVCFLLWEQTNLCWIFFTMGVLVGVVMLIIGQCGGYGSAGYSVTFCNVTGSCTIVLCVLGLLLGFIGYVSYYKDYEIYSLSPAYTQISPSSNPGALRDAGSIDFTSDARVDAYKGVGYRNGVTFCAAPILGARSATGPKPMANFWAVGIDCCGHRGRFQCGSVDSQSSVRGGLVVLDATPEFRADIPMYTKAAQQSAAQNDLGMPLRPIFVRWNGQAQSTIDHLRRDAFIFVIIASLGLFFLVLSFTACCWGLNVSPNQGIKGDFFDTYLLGDGAIVKRFFADGDPASKAAAAKDNLRKQAASLGENETPDQLTPDQVENKWSTLTPHQVEAAQALGWNSDSNEPPAVSWKHANQLSYSQKVAAGKLGFTSTTWDETHGDLRRFTGHGNTVGATRRPGANRGPSPPRAPQEVIL